MHPAEFSDLLKGKGGMFDQPNGRGLGHQGQRHRNSLLGFLLLMSENGLSL
jgi:hypothetical protein